MGVFRHSEGFGYMHEWGLNWLGGVKTNHQQGVGIRGGAMVEWDG
jgi:hypothetical protein